MARLTLMCGLAGAGKSTYAKRLEKQGWLRLSIDREAWARGLVELPFPEDLVAEIRATQRRQLVEALHRGRDVVVDYSFWSRAQRDDYRALGHAAGAEVEVVHLAVPEEELRRRLAARRHDDADDVPIPEGLLTGYLDGFETPGPEETDVRHVPFDGADVGPQP